MNIVQKVRQWIREEKRYLWILIVLALVYSTFSILNTFSGPIQKEKPPLGSEDGVSEEKWLSAIQKDPSLQLVFGGGLLALTFFFFLGVALSVRFLAQKARGKFAIPWRGPDPEIGWNLRDVFHVVVILLLLSYILEFAVVLFFHLLRIRVPEETRLLWVTCFGDLALCLMILCWVARKGDPISHLGLSKKAFPKNIFFGLTSYITLFPSLLVALFISIWLSDLFKIMPPDQPIQNFFMKENSVGMVAFGLTLVLLMGPVVEEIFFRGFFYNALKVKWGKKWAILSSGVLFAVLHANLVGFLPIALLGCLLAYSYELTGSLFTSITIHVLHNSLVMVIFFLTDRFSQLFGVFQ